MTRLFLSIIIAVLGSLFFIGLGLDKLVAEQVDYEESSEIVLFKKLIEGFSLQLSELPNEDLEHSIANINRHYRVNLTIDNINNVALPATLIAEISQSGGLMLATDQQTYLLRKIPQHENKLIKLQLPPATEEDQQQNIILTAILYIGVCTILIAWLFPLARRLFILTNAAAKIGKGELNVRVPINKFSYISPLEKSFNHMAYQIEKLMTDNKLLARSLSHDIRTPMSCLRFGVEAALDSRNIDKKNHYLIRMEAELTNMETMTSAFLDYAGMERQGVNLKLESVQINNFIQGITDELQSLAEQYNITLIFEPLANETYYSLDCHWFQRVLQNLVSNAVQYANSKVVIQLSISTDNINIFVEDDGKGLDQSKLDIIFDPFIKLDVDRSREQGHFGLGLAICQKVIDWHKGSISAKNSLKLSGAQFCISLPKK